MKYKFDGSGGHAIFNQQTNEQTSNLFLSISCPIELKRDEGVNVWIQSMPNTLKKQWALTIQTGMETAESLQSQALFHADISSAPGPVFKVPNGSPHIVC